jgi:pimeloyl-ACP methyl ester carboxylesterase
MLAVKKEEATNPTVVREYAKHLSDPAHLRGSFEWFRALNKDVDDNVEYAKQSLTMPVLAIGAAGSLGQSVPDQVRHYATNVQAEVIPDSGHWIYEEHPEEMTHILLNFLTK